MITKLISTTAAMLIPVSALSLGVGTASAEVRAEPVSSPGGVTVWVSSWAGDAPEISGWCTYTSVVQGDPIGKPAPAIGVPFYLPPGGPAQLWFPSYPTGSTWNVSITCPGPAGGESRITESTTAVW